MSPEHPVALAEPPTRRRIVSAPQRTALPVALIVRERGSLPSLEALLQEARPVVVFPSLSHFCTESHRSERWAGVIVARACAWDARLDDYVLHRECMALYGEAEGYGWPESVQRLRDDGVASWLTQLDVPRVRVPVAKPRKLRPASDAATPRAKRSRSVFSLWAPTSHSSELKSVTTVATKSASIEVRPVATSTSAAAAEPAEKRGVGKLSQQTLPFVEAAANVEKKRAGQQRRRPREGSASVTGLEDKAELRALAHAAGLRAPLQVSFGQEERLARMGAEIGLLRAYELLRQLRTRAQQAAGARNER